MAADYGILPLLNDTGLNSYLTVYFIGIRVEDETSTINQSHCSTSKKMPGIGEVFLLCCPGRGTTFNRGTVESLLLERTLRLGLEFKEGSCA